jgi:hypothetical protein
MQLLSSLDIRRDQPNVVYAGATHGVNRASNICKLNSIIALDEGRFFRALLEDILQARPQPIPGNFILIDQRISARGDLDNNRRERHNFIHRIRRLRYARIQSLWYGGRNHHENDDQDEQNINQRNNVRLRQRTLPASNRHSQAAPPTTEAIGTCSRMKITALLRSSR